MSIKILQITAAYKPAYIYGGPTMSVAKLCENLIKDQLLLSNGKNVLDLEVFTTTANGQTELNVIPNKITLVDGVSVTYFKRLTKDHTHFSPALLKALRREILSHSRNEGSLIIHIHAWWNLVSVFSCAIAKWYNIPVVLTPRGMLTAYTSTNRNSIPKKIIHNILGKNLLKYCHIHATSEKEKIDIQAIVNPKSITIIPNLVELSGHTFTQPDIEHQAKKDKALHLIYLSRIEEKKGLELLFDALTSLPFSYNLTIAGSGEESYVKSLKAKAEALKINTRINWVGQVGKEDKFKLLAAHDLMVLTSYNENFANVVIESLSVGTAVLISNEVGLADYVAEKKLGWITDLIPNNITKRLISAYESLPLRMIIREKAPQIINQDFDSNTLIQKYFKLYSQIN